MISEGQGCCWKSMFSGQIVIADPLGIWVFIPAKTKETQNTKIVEGFPTFQEGV
jgi:hypothetical protein